MCILDLRRLRRILPIKLFMPTPSETLYQTAKIVFVKLISSLRYYLGTRVRDWYAVQ